MYAILILLHSVMRWLVLASLLYAIYRAFTGYLGQRDFSKTDDRARHWTATISHIQLMIGLTLYLQSPIIKYFWKHSKELTGNLDLVFFGLIHIVLMLTAIIIITIGSALAKRQSDDKEKFRTILVWFSIALLIIVIAIPWPFSPFANRPYLRSF